MNIVMKCGILILSMCILTGCVTTNNFKSLPVESSDFELPYEELTEKFTEIPIYEKRFRGFSPNMPLAEYLINTWGEPDTVTSDRTYYPLIGGEVAVLSVLLSPASALIGGAAGLFLHPFPDETYIWLKGNYCVETFIATPFPNYKERVVHWEWTDVNTAEEISKGCNQIKQQKSGGSEHTAVQ